MRPGGTPQVRMATMLAATALAALAACGRPSPPAAPAAATARSDPDFRAPPSVVEALRTADGGVVLHGRAQPGAQVDLRSPDGLSLTTVAGPDGAWSVEAPPAAAPRAFALSAAAAGRVVRAEGALLVAPSPFAAATLLRGGAPSLPVGPAAPGLQWTGVDTDPGGGAAASGFAPPGDALRLAIEGVVRGEGTADASGRFGLLWLGGAAPPGAHAVTLSTPQGARTATVRFGPATLGGAPVRIAPEPNGWRVDWSPPGGGVQTLHLLAPGASGTARP